MQIAFWTSVRGLAGNSAITAAIAGTLAIEKKRNTVILDNSGKENSIRRILQQESIRNHPWDRKVGIEGMLQLARANKLNNINVKSYANTLVKNVSFDMVEGCYDCENESFAESREAYINSLKCLNEAYEVVCVDVMAGIANKLSTYIIDSSQIIIISLNQNRQLWSEMTKIITETTIFDNKQLVFVISKYDYQSKIKLSNLKREFKLGNVVEIPYNVDFMDNCNTGKLIEFLLRNYKCSKYDENYEFIGQMKELVEVICEVIEEVV